MSSESTDVVEIDAIGVDEWEHEQHTPRAMDENLAALVKQSSTAQSGPARAPTVDDAWEADGHGEPAKQRTTTNTVARPAPPKPKTKTMALPTIAAKPAAPKPAAVPKAIPRIETKPIASPTAAKPHTGDQPPPGFVEVKPLAARGAAKPTAKPQPQPKPVAKPAATATPPTAAAPKPVGKPAATATPPTGVAPKPVAKPTPPPMAAIVAEPGAAPKPVAKAGTKPTPPPMAAIVAEPQPVTVVLADVKPQRAPTPLPFGPMTLPAWPPTTQFEDWDSPESAATSVGNRISPSRPVSSDFKSEDSVIVDLNAKPTADKPRRPQTYPVMQTSEQKPSASGVFVMPTAAQPNATPVAPERASAPELPPPPIAPVAASSLPEADRASSPGWNTPLPERLPGEPIAAPAAPSWPSASGLLYEPSAPVADEPVPSLARPSIFAPLLPLLRNRGVVIGIAAAAVVAVVVVAIGSHDSKQSAVVAATKPEPTVAAAAAPMHATPTHAGATSAPAATAAAVETVVPSLKVPGKPPVTMRRISRSKRPVVVDYDKKPSSALDDDQALAQARTAYAIGNQHLFAGDGQEAVTAYRKALEIYPGYAAGYRGLGLAFSQLDDKPSALAAFKTYVKLAPTAKDVALIQKRIRNLSVH